MLFHSPSRFGEEPAVRHAQDGGWACSLVHLAASMVSVKGLAHPTLPLSSTADKGLSPS